MRNYLARENIRSVINGGGLPSLFLRFVFGGMPGAAVKIGFLFTLTHFEYTSAATASAWGVFSSFFVSFFIYKYWVFENTDNRLALLQFFVAFSIVLMYTGATWCLMYVFVEGFSWNKLFSFILTTIILSPLGFLALKKIFPKKPDVSV